MNYSSDLKNFANSLPSASNFKSFSRSLEQFFLTVGQNNFGNKIPLLKKEQNAHLQFLSQLPGCSLHRNKKLDIKNMNKKLEVALKK